MDSAQLQQKEKRQWAIWLGIFVAFIGFTVFWLSIDLRALFETFQAGFFSETFDWEAFGWNTAFVITLCVSLLWLYRRQYKFTYYYIAAFVLRVAYALVYTTIDVTRIETDTDYNYSISLDNGYLFRVFLMAFFVVFLLTSKQIKKHFAKDREPIW